MHDDRVEELVRGALRTEAASLPFTVSVGQLERRLADRRRTTSGTRRRTLAAAVAAIAITDLLEEAGRPVEICMMFLTHGTFIGGSPLSTTGFIATLKQSNDPLNIGSLVSALSPWFFRTVCFGMQESQSDCRVDWGRGRPDNSRQGLDKMVAALGLPENTEALTMGDIDSPSSAEAFIRQTIAKMEEE